MPNIMLTYRCNLHCSYCFANEFVNKEKTDISLENFQTALEFLTRSGETHVGLIGGEPTLHPDFQNFMEILIANQKVSGITVYTNGLLLDQYVPQIVHPKVRVLVNCNSPQIIGEKSYSIIKSNLDVLIGQYYMKDRVNLGINLFSNDLDYTYILMKMLLICWQSTKCKSALASMDQPTCTMPIAGTLQATRLMH